MIKKQFKRLDIGKAKMGANVQRQLEQETNNTKSSGNVWKISDKKLGQGN
jgi:hypothetical protein